ncbi:SDR family NAD(P)-dependent oxidoreductase [Levilactobacillus brevis]|nr:SDR family NAD(P)-dependent oxidoreductase [Levilactobacillus brevis]
MMRQQHSGRIINITSVDGKIAQPLASWYVASKFALEGLSDALRLELFPLGIDTIVIEPGRFSQNGLTLRLTIYVKRQRWGL